MHALSFFRTKPGRWSGCRQPTPAERMERYSQRHAQDMRTREALGAAPPRMRLVDGRPVLIALPGQVNAVGKRGAA